MTNNFIRGYQTTEFWITLSTIISTIAGALFTSVPWKVALLVIAIISTGYVISRGLAKINQ